MTSDLAYPSCKNGEVLHCMVTKSRVAFGNYHSQITIAIVCFLVPSAPINQPTSTDQHTKIQILLIEWNMWEQQILIFKSLEAANVWHFCFKSPFQIEKEAHLLQGKGGNVLACLSKRGRNIAPFPKAASEVSVNMWREAQSWAVNSDNEFVFKIRVLHCTPLE